MAKDIPHIYRYERKYFIEGLTRPEIIQIIKLNRAIFRPIFHERWINNIYFDTPEFDNYFDNEAGVMHRTKYRIRWYGDLWGETKEPTLELKIKDGLLGRKENFRLQSFLFDRHFNAETINKAVEEVVMPVEVRTNFKNSVPTICNRYKRKYFLSADGNFRLTVDSHLSAGRVGNRFNSLRDWREDKEHFVVELKYDPDHDRAAASLTDDFPFRLTKSSKYASSIEKLYGF